MTHSLLVLITMVTIARAAAAPPSDDFTEDTFAQLLGNERPVMESDSREETMASMEDLEAFKSHLRASASIDSLSEPINTLSSVNGYDAPLENGPEETKLSPEVELPTAFHKLLFEILKGQQLQQKFQKRSFCNIKTGCSRPKRIHLHNDHSPDRSEGIVASTAHHQFKNQQVSRTILRNIWKRFICNACGCGQCVHKKGTGPQPVDRRKENIELRGQNSEEDIESPSQPANADVYPLKKYTDDYGIDNMFDRSGTHISMLVSGLCNYHPYACTLRPRP